MNFLKRISKRNIASKNIWRQIFGAVIQWQPKSFLLFVFLALAMCGIALIISPKKPINCLWLSLLTLVVWLTIKVGRTLANTFSLRKEEERITWSQIAILIAIGFWIIGFLIIFDTKEDPKIAAAVALVGSVLSWIFQDKIKGVVAFLHLRFHHLLKVDDWIIVPSMNIDGEVKRITLTSVTVYNWDTTTSTFPISAMHSGQFQNLQNMTMGKTYGRRMYMSFIFDTGWFHSITQDELESLKKREDVMQYLPDGELEPGALNAHLYRLYLYHWLMSRERVSQRPRLIVRWQEQGPEGMPLQVYAFITEGSVVPFEWEQSQIVEHIIMSAEWFNMNLYQTPSGYDAGNSNIYMSSQPATYRKESVVTSEDKNIEEQGKEADNE
jgi:miniconductance mechanosensitive channel